MSGRIPEGALSAVRTPMGPPPQTVLVPVRPVVIESPMRRRPDFEPGRSDSGCPICDAAVGEPCGQDCMACRCSSCARPVASGSGETR